MSELIIWKNKQINRLRKDMDYLFGRLWTGFGTSVFPGEATGFPFMDLSETGDTLTVRAELPGIDPDKLDISVTSDRLTISGEKTDETIESVGYYHRVERKLGFFSRTVRLPCMVKVEGIKATYKKGILNIVMPKRKSEKARYIKVKTKNP